MTDTASPAIRKPLAAVVGQGLWDLLVVGGGATGLGVALEAQLRGLRVLLVEARDFASGTSSRSTKLLHGGVRYLAQGHWGLVREALRERATLMDLAPHLAQPLPFFVPLQDRWSFLRMAIGLGIYQRMAGARSLGPLVRHSRHDLQAQWPAGVPANYGAFEYWDGQFEDARLALALARTAQEQGACVRNYTRLVDLQDIAGRWQARLEDALTGETVELEVPCVVQATGVWADELRRIYPRLGQGQAAKGPWVKVSQGVHLVIPQARFAIQQAVLVPRTQDGRVLFALPWLGSVVLGTTDTPRSDAPVEPRAFAHEVNFIVGQARRMLGLDLRRDDIRSIWVGLRPLVQDQTESQVTATMGREHRVWRHAPGLYAVSGGKWTTYRQIGQDVVDQLCDFGDARAGASASCRHRLFGAPSAGTVAVSLMQAPGIHLWGSQAEVIESLPGHGRPLGMGLTEAMVRYSARHEWALTTEDMLARRWRSLFLDARAARTMAPAVAAILQEETGRDPQLADFLALCDQYADPPGL